MPIRALHGYGELRSLVTTTRNWSYSESYFAWVAVILALSPVGCSAEQRRNLHLEEMGSIEIPADYRAMGGRIRPDGMLAVLWSEPSRPVLVVGTDRVDTLATTMPAIAAVDVGADTVHIALRDGTIRLLTFDGISAGARRLPISDSLVDAARVDGVWYVLSQVAGPRYRVTRVSDVDDTLSTIVRFDRSLSFVHPRLAANRTGVLVSAPTTPFETISLDHELRFAFRFSPQELPSTPVAQNMPGLLIAGHLFVTGCGYMQTFTDLRSDSRLLALFDTAGRMLASAEWRDYIGMLGISADLGVLVGARQRHEREVVRFRVRQDNRGTGGCTRVVSEKCCKPASV
jgi:hypothetical protein